MNIKVTDCNDCPFLKFNGWEEPSTCLFDDEHKCLNPDKSCGKVKKTPDWCKLKSEGITVKMA